ncbi:unnamed protein product [Penicillium salamii]|uniref:Zn(2)-C6 fungal-type domain-containing protein n=1 Tax=Penicillium salamii TaxID=1612424 RepID=A0A9W4NPL1_9EURO|nr:unnamed protein product [Penicillium salamii]CAG8175217.1 unnamed protein product [Penicillium salamii]CAG8207115.1 unnamed protein product [Penicillium salamii]CAG8235304.1 unnamed protein product [Penicillium salamii]CAG8306760.1 unnamed protein product [Penicillium salamii]
MQNDQRAERGPRGKYSKLICQGCRSRKIKCVLPSSAATSTSGAAQPPESSCERCRNLELPCIVERTTSGRPSARGRQRQSTRNLRSASLNPSEKFDERASSPSDLEVNDYLFSKDNDAEQPPPKETGKSQPSQRPGKRTMFRAMIDINVFICSVLEKDVKFGSQLIHATSRWSQPLPDLIGNDMAALLDTQLSWYRLFLPSIPNLVSLRNRLVSEELSSTTPATNLLFALLCLAAFETADGFAQQHPITKQSLQLAVSSFGQEFMVSPPTHRDSIAIFLFLIEFRPTTLATSQFVMHKAVSPEIYIHLAHRIAERLSCLAQRSAFFFFYLKTPGNSEHERCFSYSVEALKVISLDCHLEGLLSKTVPDLYEILDQIQPHIDAYRHLLSLCECSPRTIFHVQWIMGFRIMITSLIEAKENWTMPKKLLKTVEEAEKLSMEQIEVSRLFIEYSVQKEGGEDIPALLPLLRMRFYRISAGLCGLGLFYAAVQQARSTSGENHGDPHVQPSESLQIVDQVAASVISPPDAPGNHLSVFIERFGKTYPDKLIRVLEAFLECTESKLDGIASRAPLQQLVYEVIHVCKNLVENNFVQVRVGGRLAPSFEKQLELFSNCAKCIGKMRASSSKKESAFASGCVYVACSKIILGLRNTLERLKTEVEKRTHDAACDVPANTVVSPGTTDCSLINMDFNPNSWDGWNLWPEAGSLSPLGTSMDMFNLVPEWTFESDFEVMNRFAFR